MVFGHLGSHPGPRWRELPEQPPPIWLAVFEEAAQPLWRLVRAADTATLRHVRAVLFADQSKAFERVGYAWLCE
eukprot:10507312-Alexandrium_andersonii.AAC.1